ncbi:MAG: hypothetical protein NXI04_21355 [Planctomycetaceae bacterium]|nr:hypothetical protein [Planctomycetaceae bacterium]
MLNTCFLMGGLNGELQSRDRNGQVSTSVRPGIISCSSAIARFVQGGVVAPSVVGHYLTVISAIITFLAVLLFAAAIKSLGGLKEMYDHTDSGPKDPLHTSFSVLFSTNPPSPEFRSHQRRIIWMFCGSMLLLYVARIVSVQSSQ